MNVSGFIQRQRDSLHRQHACSYRRPIPFVGIESTAYRGAAGRLSGIYAICNAMVFAILGVPEMLRP